MKRVKKVLILLLKIIVVLYILVCIGFYFFQEHLVFYPQKLPVDHTFEFDQNFEEIDIEVPDGGKINTLFFKADSTKGLIFYLHGNAGSLQGWGSRAKLFTDLGYDVAMLDYRGFGKSEGKITSKEQLIEDNQLVYEYYKTKYKEKDIIIMGYSIGSGMAARLASDNNPQKLILQSPYYELKETLHEHYPFIPGFLLRYNFKTHDYLKELNKPVAIIHGKEDLIIPFKSSLKLKNEFKDKINLYTIEDYGHIGFDTTQTYVRYMRNILDLKQK